MYTVPKMPSTPKKSELTIKYKRSLLNKIKKNLNNDFNNNFEDGFTTPLRTEVQNMCPILQYNKETLKLPDNLSSIKRKLF